MRGRDLGKLRALVQSQPGIERVAPLTEADSDSHERLVLELASEKRDAKEAWEFVRESLGEAVEVAPVLEDASGHALYPTGSVQVRFEEALSDEDLERFASSHRLRVVERNPHTAAQVSFRPVDPCGEYLPELVDEMNEADIVLNAWEVTESHYHRS